LTPGVVVVVMVVSAAVAADLVDVFLK